MSDTEEKHLRDAVTGNRDALTLLLAEVGPQIRGHVAGKISTVWQSTLDVDDVMQLTYLEAFLKIAEFQPRGMASFVGWLKEIAMNNLRDAIKGLEAAKRPNPRNQVREPRSDESYIALYEMLGQSMTTPSQVAAGEEARSAIGRIIDELPEDYKLVVRLYDLEGLSGAEVAHKMRRTEGAVYMLRARAHDRLRGMLPSTSAFFTKR